MTAQEVSEISFAKYKENGAYHWKKYFGSLFETDTFLRGRYDLVINQLRERNLEITSKVLEIGCGDGALCGLLYRNFKCEIFGVDPSPEGIQFSKEQFQKFGYKGSFCVTQGYDYPFESETFDAILCCDVIEHLQKPEIMIKEMQRMLKPGGVGIITTPIRTNEYPEDKFHVMEFFPNQLMDLCRSNFGEPSKLILTHPVAWFEWYTHTGKRFRSIIRMYCRLKDKLFNQNVFLQNNENSTWKNFKMQCVILIRN